MIFLLAVVLLLAAYLVKQYKAHTSKKKDAATPETSESPEPSEPHTPMPPYVIYGAWQGHTLGTTTYEPGTLKRIEEELSEQRREGDEEGGKGES